MKTVFNALSFLFILAASGLLQASDFIFEVPVKLDRIPKGIPQAKVECHVFGYRDNSEPIASGYSIRPVGSHRGELVDIVEVRASYKSMKRHISPHTYACQLLLLTPWAKAAWQQPGPGAADKSIHPRAGTTPVTRVEGIFTQP